MRGEVKVTKIILLLLVAGFTDRPGHCFSALQEVGEKESQESIEHVLRELDADSQAYPVEPLQGNWI